MSFWEKISNKFLDKSNSFKFYKKNYELYKMDNDNLNNKIKDITLKNDNLVILNKDYEDKLNELNVSIVEINKKNNHLVNLKNQYEHKLEELNKTFSHNITNLQTEIKDYKKEINDYKKEIDSCNKKINGNETKINANVNEINELKNKINIYENKIEKLKLEKETISKENNKMEEEKKYIESLLRYEIESIEKYMFELYERMDSSKEDNISNFVEVKSELVSNRGHMESLEKNISGLCERMDSIKEENSNIFVELQNKLNSNTINIMSEIENSRPDIKFDEEFFSNIHINYSSNPEYFENHFGTISIQIDENETLTLNEILEKLFWNRKELSKTKSQLNKLLNEK